MVEGVHGAFSLATAQTFWLGVVGAIVSAVAAIAIKEIPLRTTERGSRSRPPPIAPTRPVAVPDGRPSRSPRARIDRRLTSLLLSLDGPGGPHRGRRSSRAGSIRADGPPTRPVPRHAPGARHDTRRPAFVAVLDLDDLPPGSMRRVSRGDLDVLLAHTPDGIVATDDRCPHMSAPLSIGELDGCVVACPLHEGRFDLSHRRDRSRCRRPAASTPTAPTTRRGRPPAATRRSTRPARRPRRDA